MCVVPPPHAPYPQIPDMGPTTLWIPDMAPITAWILAMKPIPIPFPLLLTSGGPTQVSDITQSNVDKFMARDYFTT